MAISRRVFLNVARVGLGQAKEVGLLLQPTRRNAGLSPTRVVASGVGIMLVLVFLSTIVHVILGVFAFLLEAVVIVAAVGLAYRFLRGSKGE